MPTCLQVMLGEGNALHLGPLDMPDGHGEEEEEEAAGGAGQAWPFAFSSSL